jgi:hypothetical protein
VFKEDNPRFNSTRFLKAAGILREDWTNDEKNDGADEVHLIASQGLKAENRERQALTERYLS